MKKLIFALLFLFSISYLFAGTSHTVYIEITDINGEHPAEVNFNAWILGREDEVLTELSGGCGYMGESSGQYWGTAYIQCGTFPTQWEEGDTLYVEASTDITSGNGLFILNHNNAQFFGDMYGDYSEGPGIRLNFGQWTIPDVDFSAEPLSGAAPLEVHFTDLSDETVFIWYWDFDNDGVIDSEEQNPIYIYQQPGSYTVKLIGINGDSGNSCIKENYITVTSGAVSQENQMANTKYMLKNYPNPFNPQTTIEFYLPQKGDASLQIYNIKGQKVREISITNVRSGLNSVVWNGKDNNGNIASSGIYYYHLVVNGETKEISKCVLIK